MDKALYKELKNGITTDRLKTISATVIDCYRKKDMVSLKWYACICDIDHGSMSINQLFARVIQVYHPDKYSSIHRDIDAHYHKGNSDALTRIKYLYLFNDTERREYSDHVDIEEFYTYDESEFAYSEKEMYEDLYHYAEEPEESGEDGFTTGEYGFIEAIQSAMFGNLDILIAQFDLAHIEGEIDLSDYDIVDLKGLEKCVNISCLNISGNRIEKIIEIAQLGRLEYLYMAFNQVSNIYPLSGLEFLKELDISFNDIEDISVLLELQSLEYVNLIGNPVKTLDVIDVLVEKGVIVIY
ncbi:MAG: leucine-rich repeat domain-containing protein [Spirochaetota bacterium]